MIIVVLDPTLTYLSYPMGEIPKNAGAKRGWGEHKQPATEQAMLGRVQGSSGNGKSDNRNYQNVHDVTKLHTNLETEKQRRVIDGRP